MSSSIQRSRHGLILSNNEMPKHCSRRFASYVTKVRLGRPLVDSVVGSRHSNMKELRPGSTGRTEIRALFAFDKKRQAILLVGGDKSDDWRGWYDNNIPIADDRFDDHQAKLAKQAKPADKQQIQKGRSKR